MKILEKEDLVIGSNSPLGSWHISPHGRIFMKEGGYETKFLSEERESAWMASIQNSISQNSGRLNTLTGLLALGTFALVLWEIISFGIEHHWFGSCN